jgi:hypothetical protein
MALSFQNCIISGEDSLPERQWPFSSICRITPMTTIASRQHRATDALRSVRITRSFTMHAEGSVLIEFGNTKVLCTASVEDKVPPHKAVQAKDGSPLNTACCRVPHTPVATEKRPKVNKAVAPKKYNASSGAPCGQCSI